MKTKSIVLAIWVISLFVSCTKTIERLLEEPVNTEEKILIEESPWIFSSYEISQLEDDGGSGLTSEEIEDDMNQYIIGVSFTFKADGTGFNDIPEQGQEDWSWTLGSNSLTTSNDSQTDVYTFFTVDRNQMNFESRTTTLHTRDSVEYSVTHVGKYTFK